MRMIVNINFIGCNKKNGHKNVYFWEALVFFLFKAL